MVRGSPRAPSTQMVGLKSINRTYFGLFGAPGFRAVNSTLHRILPRSGGSCCFFVFMVLQ